MAPVSDLEPVPQGADAGQVLQVITRNYGSFYVCQAKHQGLVEYIEGLK